MIGNDSRGEIGRGNEMRRTVIALAAVGIAVSATACATSGKLTGTWTIASCQVDVTYIDATNTVDHYVPDTDANFKQHFAGNIISGEASLAAVITLVNHTGGPAALPTGLVVSFTDQSGNLVGSPQTFNKANGTGYGAAIANGQGSGEVFSPRTRFSAGQTVAESPDIGAVPQHPDLNCRVSRSRH